MARNPHEATAQAGGKRGYSGGTHGAYGGGGGGNAPHLRRKTTFTPKTKTTGGSNIKTGPYFGSNINYQKTFNPLKNWRQHATFSNMLKKNMIPGDDIPNYHQLAAYDFDKRFGLPNILSKGLATAYQYGSEGFKALKEGTDWDTAMNTAQEEARLNRLGIEGLNPSDMANYQKAFDYTNIDTSTLDDMRTWEAKYLANGGRIGYQEGGWHPGVGRDERGYQSTPSRQERVNPFEETGHLPGGAYDTREYIKSPILKSTGDVQGPSLPEGFLSKHFIPRFRSTREFKKWEALQKAKERMKRNYELLEPFLVDDEDTRQEFSAWYGPASGSVSMDPTVGLESLIGTAGLNIGPFSGQYTGGPGTNEMIDLAAGVGPVSAYYSPTTDYGALQGGIDFGPFNISGGIDTLKNKNLGINLGLEFSKGGLATMFERR